MQLKLYADFLLLNKTSFVDKIKRNWFLDARRNGRFGVCRLVCSNTRGFNGERNILFAVGADVFASNEKQRRVVRERSAGRTTEWSRCPSQNRKVRLNFKVSGFIHCRDKNMFYRTGFGSKFDFQNRVLLANMKYSKQFCSKTVSFMSIVSETIHEK